MTTTITIELPDEIARQAAQAGLFSDARIKSLFEAALDDACFAREIKTQLAQLH